MAQALMFQGTGSDVGKSLIVAGLARAFARRGLAVRPFKPQNMSNNAAVTLDGGEIGRAQALQARACGVAPSFHMNPVLLKPESEAGAQLVVQGRVEGRLGARDYQRWKGRLLPRVLESFQHMAREADLLLVEGAGSASEVNLRAGDIANMGFAEAAGLPVILIVDIERGGAIASLVGTWTLLDPPERARLRGYLVNKFRGDPTLFSGGIETVARETGLHCLGIVPYFAEARRLPAEDSLALDTPASVSKRAIKIVVPRLPRLSNFDDLDPLIAEPDVAVAFVGSGTALPGDVDLVVLPGSKATIADLASLRAEGWDIDIAAHLRRGSWLLGLCGGFQMLGRRLSDPEGVEGPPQEVEGLGLLEVDTLLGGDKRLSEAAGRDVASGEAVSGYEMHLGRTSGPGLDNPFLMLDERPEGAVSPDGRVAGCYLHGLFAADGFRHAFLSRIRRRHHSGLAYESGIDETLDRLAAHLEQNLDLDRLIALAGDVTIQGQPNWNLRNQAT